MELLIQPRNLEIDERTRSYIQRKLEPLGRRLRGVGEAKIEVRREPARSTQERVAVQVTLNVNGTLLRSEERAGTVTAAVDGVARALDRQVLKYKGRRSWNLRGKAKKRGERLSVRSQVRESEAEAKERKGPVAKVLPTGKLVRTKQFPMKAMTLEEAAFQMELLGHGFFLFLNGATQEYNVLYRRSDGDYGVIEPRLE